MKVNRKLAFITLIGVLVLYGAYYIVRPGYYECDKFQAKWMSWPKPGKPGTVSGVVTDSSGNYISGFFIEADTDSGWQDTVATDSNGYFILDVTETMIGLRIDDYGEIRWDLIGHNLNKGLFFLIQLKDEVQVE